MFPKTEVNVKMCQLLTQKS